MSRSKSNYSIPVEVDTGLIRAEWISFSDPTILNIYSDCNRLYSKVIQKLLLFSSFSVGS